MWSVGHVGVRASSRLHVLQNAGPRPWARSKPAVRAVRHAGHAGVCLGTA